MKGSTLGAAGRPDRERWRWRKVNCEGWRERALQKQRHGNEGCGGGGVHESRWALVLGNAGSPRSQSVQGRSVRSRSTFHCWVLAFERVRVGHGCSSGQREIVTVEREIYGQRESEPQKRRHGNKLSRLFPPLSHLHKVLNRVFYPRFRSSRMLRTIVWVEPIQHHLAYIGALIVNPSHSIASRTRVDSVPDS